MERLPQKFARATDPAIHDAIHTALHAVPTADMADTTVNITPDEEDVRKAEREVTRMEKREDHDISMMDEDKAASTGRLVSAAGAAKHSDSKAERDKREKSKNDNTYLQLQLQLDAMETSLALKYGDNFALDLVSDLVEDGHFTDEDYKRFASIKDPEERRRAIAEAIQEKIDAGEIDPADLKDHPWAKDWLDLHEQAVAKRDMKAEAIVQNKEVKPDANNSAVSKAALISDNNDIADILFEADTKAGEKNVGTDVGYSFAIPS